MKQFRRIIPVVLVLLLAASVISGASAATTTPQSLRMPKYTQTDCVWDGNGNIISETAHTISGEPAVNNRGFYKAEYTWDKNGNPLTESYTGLNGEPVVADGGYAKAVFTYENNSKGVPHLVAEDRYDAEGNRAVIPGSYSYRRDIWDGDQIFSTTYYDAEGSVTQPTGGYARILYSLEEDENAVVITKRYEAADGTPILGAEGGAKVISIYAKGLTAAFNSKVDNMGLGMIMPAGIVENSFANNDAESNNNILLNPDSWKTDNGRTPMLISTEIFGTDDCKTLGVKRWHRAQL